MQRTAQVRREEGEPEQQEPVVTGDSLGPGALALHHSLGYDCTRRRNLHVVDGSTLLYASGNLLHFLDCDSGELRFLRTVGGVTAIQVAFGENRDGDTWKN
jgi:hypothetical protein